MSRASENKWTPDEDEVLKAAVEKYGRKNSWQKISSCLPGRTNKSCRKRWVHSLDPTLRKGRWTATEDAQLLEAVRIHGKYWWQVARHIEGRTDDQCAKRWREKLDPSISRHPWTKPEDETLLAACELHGKKWNVISKMLVGRPAVHCRNRYQSLQRSMAATAGASTARPSSADSSGSSYGDSFSSYSPHMQPQRGSPSSTTFSSDSALRVPHYGISAPAGFTVSPQERGVRLMQPSPAPSSPASTDHAAFGYFLPPASDMRNSMDGYAHDGGGASDAWAAQQPFATNFHDPGTSSSASSASPQPFFTPGDTTLHHGQDTYHNHQLSHTRRSSWGSGVVRTVQGLGSDRRASAPYGFHMSPFPPANSAAGYASSGSPGRTPPFPARRSPLQESVAADYSSMSLSHYSSESAPPRSDPLLSILEGSDAGPSLYGDTTSDNRQPNSSTYHFQASGDPSMLSTTDNRW